MRTTLDIDERLLSAVVKATGQKSRSKAVQKVLEDYLRHRAIDELRDGAGRIALDDMQDEQRAADRQRHGLLEDLRDA